MNDTSTGLEGLEEFLATVRARVLAAAAAGRRREVHAIVIVEGHKVTTDSHLVTKDYPLRSDLT